MKKVLGVFSIIGLLAIVFVIVNHTPTQHLATTSYHVDTNKSKASIQPPILSANTSKIVSTTATPVSNVSNTVSTTTTCQDQKMQQMASIQAQETTLQQDIDQITQKINASPHSMGYTNMNQVWAAIADQTGPDRAQLASLQSQYNQLEAQNCD